MKITDRKKPVQTIPSGIWEGSRPKNKKEKNNNTTDAQGNGYPAQSQSK